jgi:DNA helicase-2/ATP-dependent DNA helicase PcrA
MTAMDAHEPHNPQERLDLFAGLTDAQQRAVSHVDGPLLVLAGPGSGKTTVVTRRVAYLIQQGVPAWQILGLTFTNKAAGEMRDRVDVLLPANLTGRSGLTITTFHAFCARLLRRYAGTLGIGERFSIYDSSDQRDAVKQAIATAGLTTKNWTPASVLSAISAAKNRLLQAAEFAASAADFYERSIARAYTIYEKILLTNDALDFDDLLLRVAVLLRDHADVRTELQARFQYLMIDEYQDTNHAQFIIAHALAAQHTNIAVVGDPDQSIYGWRGADIRNILDFEQQYPNAEIVPLGQNFRSTGAIVRAAAALIEQNRHRKAKRLYTELEEGEVVRVITCQDERQEAALIAEQFEETHRNGGVPYREMAVLYRINALSRVLEDAFRARHMPYVIARGTAFYERKEIKDALSYLRLIANPHDEVALRRIINTPTRGIGKTTLDRVEIYSIHNQLTLYQALLVARDVPQLSARAINSIDRFTAMVDAWRGASEKTGNMSFMHTDHDNTTRANPAEDASLANLVERIVRESGLESMYRKSRADEDLERLENLNELISAAAQFVMPDDRDDMDDMNDMDDMDDMDDTVDSDRDADAESALEHDIPPDAVTLAVPRIPTVLDRLSSFLESVALVSDADAIDPARGAVTLMTLHAAKGLEFDTVAMAGLEEGLLPHSRAAGKETELEEERRLCFVGMTRAKRRLQMSRAAVRTQRGMRERTIESQFLRELPEDAVEVHDFAGFDDFTGGHDAGYGHGCDGPHLDPYDDGTSLEIGTKVRHPTFGIGEVRAFTRKAVGSTARVAFRDVGEKTLVLEYARLERL